MFHHLIFPTFEKMGCVSSKTDINDTHPTIFEVMNIDELGHLVSPGQLELTETDLMLYQRGKSATQWPLRCLRKYGFDSEIFSFECGRRCPTGAGIYAFRCRRAEQLFNTLQQYIQLRNISEDNNPPVAMYMNVLGGINNEHPVPAATGPVVQRRLPSQFETTPMSGIVCPQLSISRPGSVTSNGPNSPVTPPIPENNNNKQNNVGSLLDHSYTNASILLEVDNDVLPSYINCLSNTMSSPPPTVESYVNISSQSSSRLYMNVDTNEAGIRLNTNTKDIPNILSPIDDSLDAKPNSEHCYANIDSTDLECLRSSCSVPIADLLLLSPGVPDTPPCITIREVNYAELDLIPSKSEHSSSQVTPDSPNKPNKSYVTIDFKKTNALSQSVNPSIDVVEEGSRKTRHNSTISDITTRHSNSLSD